MNNYICSLFITFCEYYLMALIRKYCFLTVIIMLLFGCSDSGNKSGETDSQGDPVSEYKLDKATEILYMIPSPIEVVSLLKKAGAEYKGEILNPAENVSKYQTTRAKAINLGIYGTDINYASMFDQTQETLFYVKCAKTLANNLGVMNAFDKETLDRIEGNIENRDSMVTIMSDTYWEADTYLKENERANISALVITGGWIEGLHIATKIAEMKPGNVKLVNRIAEQKYSLNNLVLLINTYEKDADIKYVLNDLMEIKAIYDKLETVKTQGENKVDEKTGITTIGGTKEIKISPEQVASISGKIKEIRTKYIEQN